MCVKGFSLVEVMVAMALVATCALGLAELFALSSQVTQASRVETMATMAAVSKLAELRARTWVADISPATSLTSSVDGFVDYVDGAGGAVGSGVSVPREAVFVRRWSIQPLPADPANGLVLQVVATRVTQPAARDVHLVSILARTAR